MRPCDKRDTWHWAAACSQRVTDLAEQTSRSLHFYSSISKLCQQNFEKISHPAPGKKSKISARIGSSLLVSGSRVKSQTCQQTLTPQECLQDRCYFRPERSIIGMRGQLLEWEINFWYEKPTLGTRGWGLVREVKFWLLFWSEEVESTQTCQSLTPQECIQPTGQGWLSVWEVNFWYESSTVSVKGQFLA